MAPDNSGPHHPHDPELTECTECGREFDLARQNYYGPRCPTCRDGDDGGD